MIDGRNDASVLERLRQEEENSLKLGRTLCYLVAALALFFTVRSSFSGIASHTWVALSFAGLMCANGLFLARPNRWTLFRIVFLTLVSALFLYLIASGGEYQTGHLWFFVFPPLVFYMANPKAALILMSVMLTLIIIIFRFPELSFVTTMYHPELQIRFVCTLAFTTVFTYVLDQSRRKAYLQSLKLATLHEKAARTDELTGLPNRRAMKGHLEKEQDRYRRHGSHFSIILLDIDHFKKINDTYGHDAGDYILVKFAEALQDSCRKMDVAARWGGEEFLILLPDTSLVQALAMAERLRVRIENMTARFKHQRIRFTTSCGVCSISQTKALEPLMKQADINLYQAKLKGRNMVIPLVVQKPE